MTRKRARGDENAGRNKEGKKNERKKIFPLWGRNEVETREEIKKRRLRE